MSSESDCAECQGPRAATVTVAFVTVGVKRIEWKDGDTWKEGPALVPITQSVQLRVIADPTGASFPPLQPEWSSNPNLPEMQIPGPNKSVTPQAPDLYTLTATAGGSSADITVIAYSIRMLLPHGDPTVSATDWNNHSSDAANEGNEITFKSHNTQPKCTLTCEAEILPAAAEAILAPKVTWTVDQVGTIAATWSSSVTGHSGIGQGKEVTATYQSQNGLPPNNDDFGRKNVILSFNGQAIDSSDFEVFYPKNRTQSSRREPDTCRAEQCKIS